MLLPLWTWTLLLWLKLRYSRHIDNTVVSSVLVDIIVNLKTNKFITLMTSPFPQFDVYFSFKCYIRQSIVRCWIGVLRFSVFMWLTISQNKSKQSATFLHFLTFFYISSSSSFSWSSSIRGYCEVINHQTSRELKTTRKSSTWVKISPLRANFSCCLESRLYSMNNRMTNEDERMSQWTMKRSIKKLDNT